jgi:hypothetical protein
MDSRKPEKCHPFPPRLSGRIGVGERLKDDSLDGKTVVAGIVNGFCRDEPTVCIREKITNCCRLPQRRSLEEEKGC